MNNNENNKSLPGALLTFVSGLFGTRTQITYAVVGMVVYIMFRGAQMARGVQDIVALLNASVPIVLLVLSAWFGGKAYMASLAAKASNGNSDLPSEDPLARLERMEGE